MTHYWTSNRTRRIEYAAIDAASRGFRGFVSKLVPDCFLGPESSYRRGGQFWCDKAGGKGRGRRRGSEDGGSVRRYRLDLDGGEEEEGCEEELGEDGEDGGGIDEKMVLQEDKGKEKGWGWRRRVGGRKV